MNLRLILTAWALVALSVSPLRAGAAPEPVAAVTGPIVGAAAPDFTLTTVDGRTLRLADFRGRTLVINVWGSWCPPCRLETPDLIAESTADRAHDVAFVGVDTTETAAAVRAFAAAKGVDYPQVATTGGSAFAHDYDIRNYPTTFVIGPDGILRARHADNLLPRAQLHAYIVAARDGRTAPLRSALQTRLDALLDPAAYPLDGDDATVRANALRAIAAIDHVDELMDDAMDDQTQDHDLVATQAEQERLRAAVIAAFTPLAKGDADTALLARLRGDEAVAQGRWSDADTAYAQAVAIDPADREALAGQSYAASQLGDDARVEQLDTRIAQLAPSPSAFVGLGKAQARRGEIAAAEASFEQALGLAQTPVAVAWTNLYFGRMEAEAGRRAAARTAFAHALAAAVAIPSSNPRSAWYIEQSQEGMVALGVTPGAAPSLSLAPWTGPDLPGSIASTIKYRLAVTGTRGTSIALTVRGLPLHWIGSFCTDRVCAPFTTTLVVPAGGVKIVEFQVIPIGRSTAHMAARIDATVGRSRVASAPIPA
jgi:peroxiredoxin/predicted negative regulator of RcsB-dependent stress response